MRSISIMVVAALIGTLATPVVAQTGVSGYPVAGTRPFERPAGAPTIHEVQKTPEWYQRALSGIEPPYPESLGFLDDQGNWYTPFNHPGMTGRYDIRGWHRK